jgi:endo-1,4-beta-xylanase
MLQTWGFTDKYSWIPAFTNNKQGWALPFDLNYNKKPAYDGMLNALTGK